MPEAVLEFTNFARKLSTKAITSRKELSQSEQVALLDIIDELTEDPNRYPHRNIQITQKIIVYTHPKPRLQATLEIDSDNKVIYFLHFAALRMPVTKQVFISYSHEDKEWLLKLKKWLKPLEQRDIISTWDDTEIKAGTKWREEIKNSLHSAKAALLLVSQNFLASDFIANNELPPLLEAAEKEGLIVFWIAVSDSTYKDTDIANYQALNNPEEPLDTLKPPDQNKALRNIYERMKQAVE